MAITSKQNQTWSFKCLISKQNEAISSRRPVSLCLPAAKLVGTRFHIFSFFLKLSLSCKQTQTLTLWCVLSHIVVLTAAVFVCVCDNKLWPGKVKRQRRRRKKVKEKRPLWNSNVFICIAFVLSLSLTQLSVLTFRSSSSTKDQPKRPPLFTLSFLSRLAFTT